MSNVSVGMLAISLAGHDVGSIYFVQEVDGEYVYLVDGSIRRINKPKKKNIKHIQVIRKMHDIEEAQKEVTRNETIKRLIKQYKREHNN